MKVYSRREWGARPLSFSSVDWGGGTVIRVHHTAGPRPFKNTRAYESRLMRETESFHIDVRKYAGIAYNYVIMPSGRVYQGRGGQRLGAHTLGHNVDAGVCFAGNYEVYKLTKRQRVAFWRLRRYLRKKYGISVNHYPHSASFPTSCCGKYAKKQLGYK